MMGFVSGLNGGRRAAVAFALRVKVLELVVQAKQNAVDQQCFAGARFIHRSCPKGISRSRVNRFIDRIGKPGAQLASGDDTREILFFFCRSIRRVVFVVSEITIRRRKSNAEQQIRCEFSTRVEIPGAIVIPEYNIVSPEGLG